MRGNLNYSAPTEDDIIGQLDDPNEQVVVSIPDMNALSTLLQIPGNFHRFS